MRTYVKPALNVIGLELKENIAAVPTTVYKGTSEVNQATLINMALSAEGTGLAKDGTYVVS